MNVYILLALRIIKFNCPQRTIISFMKQHNCFEKNNLTRVDIL